MNEQDKITLDLIQQQIDELGDLGKMKVDACADQLRRLVAFYGPLGVIALAKVGAEAQAGVL